MSDQTHIQYLSQQAQNTRKKWVLLLLQSLIFKKKRKKREKNAKKTFFLLEIDLNMGYSISGLRERCTFGMGVSA